MADQFDPPPPPNTPPAETAPFRWRASFEHAREPLFVLNQHRRLLGVNRAWEELLHIRAASARGLICSARRAPADPSALETVARALSPPADVFEGRPARVRRLITGPDFPRQWWDLDFLPFRDGKDRLRILGKISRVLAEAVSATAPLPERLVALRERLDQRYGLEQSVSALPSVTRVAEQVRLAGANRAPVLIVGEPGTGKEWVARSIHHQGPTRTLHFAALDCASLPATALAHALFGDTALLASPALGTLFLKEVSRLPRDLQDRLADWLGETHTSRPRLVAGSSADPAESVRTGSLLESLHCGLSTLVIALPPLRDRPADLPWLVERMLERAGSGEEKAVGGLTPAAWELLRAHRWPGNLRELYAVLTSARARAQSEQIDAPDLPAALRLAVKAEGHPARSRRLLPLDQILERVESRLITLALRQAGGNKSRAAELLSIWRTRLVRRVEILGITEK